MRTLALLALAAVLQPATAFAQADPAGEDDVLSGDHVTIGVGAIYGPSYDGSNDAVVSPVPLVQGRFEGVTLTPRAGGLALDVIPDADDARFGFSLGPVVSYSANRARQIKDPVVRAAGKLDEAVEVGVNGGVTAYRVLNGYDALTLSGDVKWDVAGAYKGMTWSPGITYLTPISRAALVTLSLSARHVDDDYARYYYSVTPAQGAASGLPVFAASGGWDSATLGLLGGYDLDGNMLNGGLAVFGLAAYSRMFGDAKDTPYTALRGDADQWTFGGGLAYTF
ncbi:MipA/OmpV family protein [Novosphingobium album (ex Liu et al. 2023)]|uniref:MipA/OmpV family protein n=1 Tax=Novosphingobium album (ex Liu et al. 2023) TaxID=3031130 RepID=A0ABT5WJQ9_9SPHN|nr:MipA/OmpV family protein [Novosphingobium album (ex Liu et al. 2023)]MDE8650266.1 MipA/OmpV family protein [Novosphingobium album (ex Liu et al. 2023)]